LVDDLIEALRVVDVLGADLCRDPLRLDHGAVLELGRRAPLEVDRERDTEREDHHHEDVGDGEDEPRANLRDRLLGFFDRAESEPDPADRGDVRRMRDVVLGLLAEPRDVDVQGLGGAEPMRVPDLVHDPLSTKDLAGVRHKQMQKVELAGREHDRIPVLRDRRDAGSRRRAPIWSGLCCSGARPRRMTARIRAVSSREEKGLTT
jgi:hypothetical protein